MNTLLEEIPAMATPIHLRSRPNGSWLARYREQGYFFKYVAVALMMLGFALHLTRLVIGDAMLLRYVYTPAFDMAFVVPMAYAAVSGILSWRSMRFRARPLRIVIGVLLFYITGSLPIHIPTFFTHWTGYISWFPMWFSVVLLPWYLMMSIAILLIRYRPR